MRYGLRSGCLMDQDEMLVIGTSIHVGMFLASSESSSHNRPTNIGPPSIASWRDRSSAVVNRFLILRAGTPAHTSYGGTSLVTTAIAPMIEPLPIETPCMINAPKPIQTSSPSFRSASKDHWRPGQIRSVIRPNNRSPLGEHAVLTDANLTLYDALLPQEGVSTENQVTTQITTRSSADVCTRINPVQPVSKNPSVHENAPYDTIKSEALDDDF